MEFPAFHDCSTDVVRLEVWMLPESLEPHLGEHRALAVVDWVHARQVQRLLRSDIDTEEGVWSKDGRCEHEEGRHLRLFGNLLAEVDDIAIAKRAVATETVGQLSDRERPSQVRG